MEHTIRDEIRKEVTKLLKGKVNHVNDTDKLVTSALLTSLTIVELATWVEKKFGIDFSAQRFNIYDFETIETIEALIRKK